jgi:hypothetical protein
MVHCCPLGASVCSKLVHRRSVFKKLTVHYLQRCAPMRLTREHRNMGKYKIIKKYGGKKPFLPFPVHRISQSLVPPLPN